MIRQIRTGTVFCDTAENTIQGRETDMGLPPQREETVGFRCSSELNDLKSKLHCVWTEMIGLLIEA